MLVGKLVDGKDVAIVVARGLAGAVDAVVEGLDSVEIDVVVRREPLVAAAEPSVVLGGACCKEDADGGQEYGAYLLMFQESWHVRLDIQNLDCLTKEPQKVLRSAPRMTHRGPRPGWRP